MVISQYFYPEQFRINDICKEWVNRGYQVTVITGIPNYPVGKFYKGYGIFKKRRDCHDGVSIVRLPLIPRGKNVMMLTLNYLSFVVSGFFWNTFNKIKADCVFVFEVSPMTQALPGIWYSRKRRVPCYLYVQDLWPENVEFITGIANKKVLGLIGRMVDYIYEGCTRVFTASNSFVQSIHQRGISLEKLEYWPQYAEDFYKPFVEKEGINSDELPFVEEECFRVVFTGNLGQAQGLDILPKAAVILKEKDMLEKIRFIIIGDGRYKDTLHKMVKEANVDKMFHFVPKQPGAKIPRLLATGDVAFLCLADDPLFAMTIPAKLQSYLACGMPILASASGETARIIEESRAGVVCQAGDARDLAEKIILFSALEPVVLKQMGSYARQYYEKNFDKEYLLKRMDQYLMKNEGESHV